MNRYRVTGERPVRDSKPGDEFEAELDSIEESRLVDSGRITILPRVYRVVGPRVVHETPPGETFERALRVHEEAALVAAGQVERVDEAAKPKRTSRKSPTSTRRRRAASTTTRKEQ